MNSTSTTVPCQRCLVHLLTTPPDAFTQSLLTRQATRADALNVRMEIVDLAGAERPDYDRVLDQIFAADSVSTW